MVFYVACGRCGIVYRSRQLRHQFTSARPPVGQRLTSPRLPSIARAPVWDLRARLYYDHQTTIRAVRESRRRAARTPRVRRESDQGPAHITPPSDRHRRRNRTSPTHCKAQRILETLIRIDAEGTPMTLGTELEIIPGLMQHTMLCGPPFSRRIKSTARVRQRSAC